MTQPCLRHGLTLIEVLVAISILCILLALTVPLLSRSRGTGQAAVSMANLRGMSVGVQLYADSNRDLPPVIGRRVQTGQGWDFTDVGRGNESIFRHGSYYSYAVTSLLGDIRIANAPGNPSPHEIREVAGVKVCQSDYDLTNTLYASPDFFDWSTQIGPEQFGPQRLISVAFPAAKGMMWQKRLFHRPDLAPVIITCCTVDVETPIGFFDHSVAQMKMRRMPPGIFNIYDNAVWISPSIDPSTASGPPVADTKRGTQGRDR